MQKGFYSAGKPICFGPCSQCRSTLGAFLASIPEVLSGNHGEGRFFAAFSTRKNSKATAVDFRDGGDSVDSVIRNRSKEHGLSSIFACE